MVEHAYVHIALSQRFDGHVIYKLVKCLINNGVDVNVVDYLNGTALYMASVNGYINIVKMLVEHPMIKENIDTCTFHRQLTLFALMDRLLNKQKSDAYVASMSDFKQFFQFVVEYGIKTKNDGLIKEY